MSRSRIRATGLRASVLLLSVVWACAPSDDLPEPAETRWLAGDHHIHSRFSVGWDRETDPPSPIVGGDAIYPVPMNALMARHHGLTWMVSTDHGGPGHSRVNLEMAYPELERSREVIPDLIQFYGMEFDTPGADHSSLIIPRTPDEATRLRDLERDFAKNEPWPPDEGRDTEPLMLEALAVMRDLSPKPVLIANHPSRSAPDMGVYGLDAPAEFRAWNDAAPQVAVGMAGAPGHQATTLNPDGSLNPARPRGAYGRAPTMGGFDQLTARLGGFWDSMLGEGRRWWITANSDSHVHWREGGVDFWPGEYSKTYVYAEPTYESVLTALRAGRVFVTTGDLISDLEVTAQALDGTSGNGSGSSAGIGGVLRVAPGARVRITVRVLDPGDPNHGGHQPELARVDLIGGQVVGPALDPSSDANPTTRVLERFGPDGWTRDGEHWTMSHVLESVDGNQYVRVRGTNTEELEPEPDPRGEDPWSDLWFYSNPIFLEVEDAR